jgi:hypothetical protein
MHAELADHIALIAAPIYAALLERHWTYARCNIPPEVLSQLRGLAITQAMALRQDALETKA